MLYYHVAKLEYGTVLYCHVAKLEYCTVLYCHVAKLEYCPVLYYHVVKSSPVQCCDFHLYNTDHIWHRNCSPFIPLLQLINHGGIQSSGSCEPRPQPG